MLRCIYFDLFKPLRWRSVAGFCATCANLKVAKERAPSVVDALVMAYGIASTRLAPEGRGSLSPVASNSAPEGRAQNRRVEVVILK